MKRVDQYVDWIKDHKIISIIVFLGLVVISLSEFLDASMKIVSLFKETNLIGENKEEFDVNVSTIFLGKLPVDINTINQSMIFTSEPNKYGLIATNKNLVFGILIDIILRITNFSSRPVTIEDVDVILEFRDFLVVKRAVEIVSIKTPQGDDITFPQFVHDGQQIMAIANIIWPLEKEAVEIFRDTCGILIKQKAPVRIFLECLNAKNLRGCPR